MQSGHFLAHKPAFLNLLLNNDIFGLIVNGIFLYWLGLFPEVNVSFTVHKSVNHYMLLNLTLPV